MAEPLYAVVDLSHYNGDVDLGRARAAGILGVIEKATQGTAEVDPDYRVNRDKARTAGLLWGAYHFGVGADGAAQAEHFLNTVGNDPGTLLALDFEANPGGPSMTLDQARDFVTGVRDRTGRYPGLYGGSYLKQLLGDGRDPTLAQCWFWLAEYGPEPRVPPNWPTWTLWQYTDGHVGPRPYPVDGIGACDRDAFNGGEDQLLRLWGVSPGAAG